VKLRMRYPNFRLSKICKTKAKVVSHMSMKKARMKISTISLKTRMKTILIMKIKALRTLMKCRRTDVD